MTAVSRRTPCRDIPLLNRFVKWQRKSETSCMLPCHSHQAPQRNSALMVSIVIIKTFFSKAIGELFVETFEIFKDTQITFNVQVNKRTQSINELTKKNSLLIANAPLGLLLFQLFLKMVLFHYCFICHKCCEHEYILAISPLMLCWNCVFFNIL